MYREFWFLAFKVRLGKNKNKQIALKKFVILFTTPFKLRNKGTDLNLYFSILVVKLQCSFKIIARSSIIYVFSISYIAIKANNYSMSEIR